MPTTARNYDPRGDVILHDAVVALLTPLRDAVEMNSPHPWRAYVNNRFISMYVRATERMVQTKRMKEALRVRTVELGSIDVEERYRGRGALKAVLAEMQSIAKSSGRVVYIENVNNPWLHRWFSVHPEYKVLRQYDGLSGTCFAHFP